MKNIVHILSCLLLLVSCADLSDIEKRLDKLEGEIADINSAVEALRDNYSSGKIITDIQPSQSNDECWKITFSDGSFIEILNGVDTDDGQLPYLLIDGDGYWCVSYDCGATYSRIMDNSASYILSMDGADEEGTQLKIDIDEVGKLSFLLYKKSQPDNIIDKIETPYTIRNKGIIAAVINDRVRRTLTITLSDGSTFVFDKENSLPASIAILTTSNLALAPGSTVSFEFRVNPSTAVFNYDVNSEDCDIALDVVGSSRSSYITEPVNYKLTKVEQVYSKEGVLKEGQYRAYITDLEKNKDYSDFIALVLTVTDKNNEKVQISSSAVNIMVTGNLITSFSFLKKNNENVTDDVVVKVEGNELKVYSSHITDLKKLRATFVTNGYRVYVNGVEQINGVTENDFSSPLVYKVVASDGKVNEYKVSVHRTNLAVVYINTPNEASIPSKTEDWLTTTYVKIVRNDGTIDFECPDASIKIRGNTTSSYPKKPYSLKLERKASILGMPKHKRWVLLANWMDRTLLRNSVAFCIAKQTGLAWTPNGEFVEVVLNGKHIGNYYLCEQIKIDENRVNVNEMLPTDTGDDATGGFLLELDVHYDEVNKFKSSKKNFPYMIKEPDENELSQEQFDYIVDYVNDFERELYSDFLFSSGTFRKYIDEDSFIDQWFVFELAQNGEIGHPKSCYMYKDKGGKLFSGPVWDFDWGTFIPGLTSYKAYSHLYYGRLFTDEKFRTRVKERWGELKPKMDNVLVYIDSQKMLLEESAEANIELWPISSRVNGDETLTFQAAVQRLRLALQQRINWLGTQINNM